MPQTESERNPNIPLEDYIKSEISSLIHQDGIVVPTDPNNQFSVEIAAKREFDLKVSAAMSGSSSGADTDKLIRDCYTKTWEQIGENGFLAREELAKTYLDYLVFAEDWRGAGLFIGDGNNFESSEVRESAAGYLTAKAFLSESKNNSKSQDRTELVDGLMDGYGNSFVYVVSYMETLSDVYAKTLNLEGLLDVRAMINHSVREQFDLESEFIDPQQEMFKARFEFLNQTNELNCLNVRFKTCQTDSDKKEFIRGVEDVEERWNFQLLFIEEMLKRGKKLNVPDLKNVVKTFLNDVIDETESDDEGVQNLYGNILFTDGDYEDQFSDDVFSKKDRVSQLVGLAKILAPYNQRYGLDIWGWFVEGGQSEDDTMVLEDRTIVGLVSEENNPVKKAKIGVELVKIASWSGYYERAVDYANETKKVLESGQLSRVTADELRSVIDLELMVNFPVKMGGYDLVETALSGMAYDRKFAYACELVLGEFKHRQHLSESFVESKLNWLFEVLYEEPVGLLGSAFVNLFIDGARPVEEEVKIDDIWFIDALEEEEGSTSVQKSKVETQEIAIGQVNSEDEDNDSKDKLKALASVLDDKLYFLEAATHVFVRRGEEDLIFGLINHPEISKEIRARFLLGLAEKMKIGDSGQK